MHAQSSRWTEPTFGDVLKNFYSELYTSGSQTNCNTINDFLAKLNIPEIPPKLKTGLHEPMYQLEVSSAKALIWKMLRSEMFPFGILQTRLYITVCTA